MPRINYEATIRKAFDEHGRSLGTSLAELIPSMDGVKAKCYFFLERETRLSDAVGWDEHKEAGLIRHCTPVKGGYYDYIVAKEFKTLNDWAADCGAVFIDIVYGVNHYYDGDVAYMSLSRLCNKIGAVYHPEPVKTWACPVCLAQNQPASLRCLCCDTHMPVIRGHSCEDGIRAILEHKGLSMDNLWVINDGTPVQWNSFTRA